MAASNQTSHTPWKAAPVSLDRCLRAVFSGPGGAPSDPYAYHLAGAFSAPKAKLGLGFTVTLPAATGAVLEGAEWPDA